MKPRFITPEKRREHNIAYLGALMVPQLAQDIKRVYPGLNVDEMLSLDERFYSDARSFIAQQISRLEEIHRSNK
ncbi:hypothetical protein [Synechococcus phage Ssp-JY38]|nr:hypothetical protein [Synechococcus phage Yong-L2-223]